MSNTPRLMLESMEMYPVDENPAHLRFIQSFAESARAYPYRSEGHDLVLASCKGAVSEHLLTAREALQDIRSIEDNEVPTRREIQTLPDGGRKENVTLELNSIGRRFSRTRRIFLNEARATLESLVFEIAYAFGLIPKRKDGTENERDIGFYYPRLAATLQSQEKKTPDIVLLHEHLYKASESDEFDLLDAMRSVVYHRNLLSIMPKIEMTAVETEGGLTLGLPKITFLDPRNPMAIEYIEGDTVRSLERLEALERWLTEVVDNAYFFAARALRGSRH